MELPHDVFAFYRVAHVLCTEIATVLADFQSSRLFYEEVILNPVL